MAAQSKLAPFFAEHAPAVPWYFLPVPVAAAAASTCWSVHKLSLLIKTSLLLSCEFRLHGFAQDQSRNEGLRNTVCTLLEAVRKSEGSTAGLRGEVQELLTADFVRNLVKAWREARGVLKNGLQFGFLVDMDVVNRNPYFRNATWHGNFAIRAAGQVLANVKIDRFGATDMVRGWPLKAMTVHVQCAVHLGRFAALSNLRGNSNLLFEVESPLGPPLVLDMGTIMARTLNAATSDTQARAGNAASFTEEATSMTQRLKEAARKMQRAVDEASAHASPETIKALEVVKEKWEEISKVLAASGSDGIEWDEIILKFVLGDTQEFQKALREILSTGRQELSVAVLQTWLLNNLTESANTHLRNEAASISSVFWLYLSAYVFSIILKTQLRSVSEGAANMVAQMVTQQPQQQLQPQPQPQPQQLQPQHQPPQGEREPSLAESAEEKSNQ